MGDLLSPAIIFGPDRPLGVGGSGITRGGTALPSVRGFKISENENPRPQDRIYFGFNYFDSINESINQRLGSEIHDVRVYREIFGFEKTFLDGDASVGLRLPLNTLNFASEIEGLGGADTALGDLTAIFKYALINDRTTGNALPIGLAVTAPTGASHLGGTPLFTGYHSTVLQPFTGYVYNLTDRLYSMGFSALDIPMDSRDVTYMTNDISVGYYLFRAQPGEDRLVTGVVPTFEVHVTTPLNHRGAFVTDDPMGAPDVVAFTAGTTFVFGQRSTLAIGYGTPVTGPRPYSYEILAQLNVRFGARGVGPAAPMVLR